MGGRGGNGGAKAGSADGTIISGKSKKFSANASDEVLEAQTDEYGNLTFSKAKPVSRNGETVNYELKAGAINGELFNVDIKKAQSINGKTYSLKGVAKESGMKWNGERWSRGFKATSAQERTKTMGMENAKKTGAKVEYKNASDGTVLIKTTSSKGTVQYGTILTNGKVRRGMRYSGW